MYACMYMLVCAVGDLQDRGLEQGRASTYPAGPADEVIQLGHYVLAPATGKCGRFRDHSSCPCYMLGAGHSEPQAQALAKHMPLTWGPEPSSVLVSRTQERQRTGP